MIRRIRDWLYNKFLPWETKEQYQQEIKELRKRDEAQKARIRELEAYIDGVHAALRSRAKIEIKNEVSK